MDVSKTLVCYMTGTGTTEKYAKAFAEALPGEVTVHELNAGTPVPDDLGANGMLVVAAPVYGGHIPPFVWSQLAELECKGAPAVAIAVYGARDYDSALLEMQADIQKMGAKLVGAAGVVARHSIIQTIAADRPNADDLAGMKKFAEDVISRVNGMGSIDDAPSFEFKGQLEENIEPTGIVPMVNDNCTFCGICAQKCPALAIPDSNPNTTNAELCISCLRCIDICPFDARCLPEPMLEAIGGMLAQAADPTKANEYF